VTLAVTPSHTQYPIAQLPFPKTDAETTCHRQQHFLNEEERVRRALHRPVVGEFGIKKISALTWMPLVPLIFSQSGV
jgi:hypothetical protein